MSENRENAQEAFLYGIKNDDVAIFVSYRRNQWQILFIIVVMRRRRFFTRDNVMMLQYLCGNAQEAFLLAMFNVLNYLGHTGPLGKSLFRHTTGTNNNMTHEVNNSCVSV
jgi:hypothetical protein